MKNYSLENPFAENDLPSPVKDQEQEVPSRYQEMVDRGRELLELRLGQQPNPHDY